MEIVLGYITHENEAEALRVVDHLLKKRLIACANVFPVRSCFWWKGKIQRTGEAVSIVKTQERLWEQVVEEVSKVHSYEVPCIVRINAACNPSFGAWIEEETRAVEGGTA